MKRVRDYDVGELPGKNFIDMHNGIVYTVLGVEDSEKNPEYVIIKKRYSEGRWRIRTARLGRHSSDMELEDIF